MTKRERKFRAFITKTYRNEQCMIDDWIIVSRNGTSHSLAPLDDEDYVPNGPITPILVHEIMEDTDLKDINEQRIHEDDIIDSVYGMGVIELKDATFCIKFFQGEYADSCENDEQKYLPLSYVVNNLDGNIKVVSNVHINRDKKEALTYGFRENHTEAKVAEAVITDESMDIGRRGLSV